MSVFRHRYAGLNRQECDREALLLIEKAAETRNWSDPSGSPERIAAGYGVCSYACGGRCQGGVEEGDGAEMKILCSSCFDRLFGGWRFYLQCQSVCTECGCKCLGYSPSAPGDDSDG